MFKIKRNLYILLSTLIILAGGSIIAFLIAAEYNGRFWVSYISFIVSIIYFSLSSLYFAKPGNGEVPAKFSLVTCGVLYVLVTGILIIIGHIFTFKLGLYLALHILCLCVFLILLISVLGSYDYINNQNSQINNNKQYINTLCTEVSKLLNKASSLPKEISAEITPLLKSLQDKIRYMDPMTNTSVAAYENQIQDGIRHIENTLNYQEANNDLVLKIKEQVKDLTDTISIRNEILKASK